METFCGEAAIKLIAVLAVLIIIANLNGAIFAASRLFYASSREKILPKRFAKIHPHSLVPSAAIYLAVAIFLVVETLLFLDVWSQSDLLELAGQNFFLLYMLSVLVYIKLASSWKTRTFGILTLTLAGYFMSSFGWSLLYPLALMLVGLLLNPKK